MKKRQCRCSPQSTGHHHPGRLDKTRGRASGTAECREWSAHDDVIAWRGERIERLSRHDRCIRWCAGEASYSPAASAVSAWSSLVVAGAAPAGWPGLCSDP